MLKKFYILKRDIFLTTTKKLQNYNKYFNIFLDIFLITEPFIFTISYIIISLHQNEYNQIRDTISRISLGEHSKFQDINFIIFGIYLFFISKFLLSSVKKNQNFIPILITSTTISLTIFRSGINSNIYKSNIENWTHTSFAFFLGCLGIIFFINYIKNLQKTSIWKNNIFLKHITIFIFITSIFQMFLLAVGIFGLYKPILNHRGIIEKIAVSEILLWLEINFLIHKFKNKL